jgi:hypothetical protein
VDQGNEIEAIVDRVVETDLLIATVSLVGRVEENRQRERQPRIAAKRFATIERPVGRAVVDDEHLDVIVIEETWRDALERRLDRFFRVVRDDEDQQARTAVIVHQYL